MVLCDVQTNSFLATFDANTGKELWRTPRGDVPTWGTPTVVKVGARTQILVNGWHHSGAYDFETGEEIWRHDGGGDIPVPTPIVSGELGYFTSAHGRFRPMQAVWLEAARGDITAEDLGTTNEFIAWSHPRRGNYMQTPLTVNGLLFACYDNGVLSCFDARTGESHFEERIKSGIGFSASPVSDGRNLFFPSERGDVFVVPVDRDFSVVATNRMNETIMASPAMGQGRLFLRTRNAIVAVGQQD